ncbi:unnamed protein product [Arctogadus glacialis]
MCLASTIARHMVGPSENWTNHVDPSRNVTLERETNVLQTVDGQSTTLAESDHPGREPEKGCWRTSRPVLKSVLAGIVDTIAISLVGGSTTNRIRSARLHLNDACWRSKTKDKMFSVQPLIIAALLSQLVLVVGFCAKGNLPGSHLTKEAHPELYAAKVVYAEVVKKPLDHLPVKFGWISHSGVLLTVEVKLLTHKIGCGAVLQDPAVMEGVQWEKISERECFKGATVGELLEAGGSGYNVGIDNCHQYKNMVDKKIKRTMEKK